MSEDRRSTIYNPSKERGGEIFDPRPGKDISISEKGEDRDDDDD